MEAQNQKAEPGPVSPKSVRYDDPIVIGAGALALGFIIGSGRARWLLHESAQVLANLGVLAVQYMAEAFQQQNPDVFGKKYRVTH